MQTNIKRYKWLLPFIFFTISSCSFNHNSSVTQATGTSPASMVIKNPAGYTQPVLASNSSGTYSNVSITPIFYWSGDGDTYDIFIQSSNGITDPNIRINQQPITTTNYSVATDTALKLNTTYLWKVRSYYKSSGEYVDSKVLTFSTMDIVNAEASGYVMTLSDTQVENSNHVIDVLFQVSLNNVGVTNLAASDFEVYEDGELASSSESVITLSKVPNVPTTLQSVILIDNSTSLTPNLSSIQAAVNTLISTIAGINITNITQTMKIEYFSDQLESLFDGTESGAGAGTRIQLEASSALNRGGLGIPQGAMSTDFYGSVINGANLLKSSYSLNGINQSVMFVLSDGNDTQGSSTLSSAINAVGNNLVYTIGFGAEMRSDILTEVGSGGFFDASTTQGFSTLQNNFLSLTGKLANYANSFYKLSYVSPKRGSIGHTIIIKLKGVQDAAIQTTYIGW